MKTYREYMTESSLSRIWSKTRDADCAMMSASRSENSPQKNAELSKHLHDKLRLLGYSVTRVTGGYIENKGLDSEKEITEVSFFIQNTPNDPDFQINIAKFGEYYKQESVLLIPRGGRDAFLLGTIKGGSYPEYGKTIKVGNATYGRATSAYFSRIKGRTFEFISEAVEMEPTGEPSTLFGKWGMGLSIDDLKSLLSYATFPEFVLES